METTNAYLPYPAFSSTDVSLSSNTNNSFDLNINNYSIDDLFDIYKIRKNDQGNVTAEYIQKATAEIIRQYYAMNPLQLRDDKTGESYEDEYVIFFNNAKSRILQHLQSGSAFINDSMYQQQYKSTQQYGENSLVGGDQSVMLKRDEPYQNSVAYEYPKGTINPIERRILKRIICIDTLFRTNYDKTKSTDFIWNLPTPINNVLSLQVASAQIPNMVRTFSAERGNNVFIVHLYNVNTGTTGFRNQTEVVVIPEGVYMADVFTTAMNNYFANAPPPADASLNGLKFLYMEVNDKTTHTVIRSRETSDTDFADTPRPFKASGGLSGSNYSPNFYFKLDFNIPDDKSFTDFYKYGGVSVRSVPVDPSGVECSNAGFQRTHMNSKTLECFRPTFSPLDGKFSNSNTKMRQIYKNAGWMMGFRKDIYDTSGNPPVLSYISTSATNTVVTYNRYVQSESSYGSTIPQYFFIELDDYNRNFTSNTIIAETGNGTYLGNNIVARIPITSSIFNIVHSNPSDLIYKRRDYFGPVKIEKINIRLLDRYGEILDIVNNDYAIAIELTTMY
jgi:hypothetical protein